MTSKSYCRISSLIFGIVALVHVVRVANHWVFQIGPLLLPSWVSLIGALLAAGLSFWGMRLARR
jgi:hypothetical protein